MVAVSSGSTFDFSGGRDFLSVIPGNVEAFFMENEWDISSDLDRQCWQQLSHREFGVFVANLRNI